MTELKPHIAIPEPTSADEAYNRRSMPQYIRAVEAAGGVAVPLLLGASAGAQENLLAGCSGILLPGSPADLDPERYGQQAATETAAKDSSREMADDLLLKDAFAHGKPVLGICFGLQALNVFKHGSLIQHLPLPEEGEGGVVNHRPGREVQEAHLVRLVPGSRLAGLISEGDTDGAEKLIAVNSSHHQAVDRPGADLTVVATSEQDGIIEAVESSDPNHFVVAVQWHPERSYDQSEAARALFRGFIEAARAWKSAAEATRPAGQ